MVATTAIENERHTYGEWQALGRQVKKGERRGTDGRFAHNQTKGKGGSRGGHGCRTCATCGSRINYGVYCGKCEFGR